MASTSTSEPSVPVIFHTRTAYPLPSQKFFVPASWRRYQLSQLVNKALGLAQPVPFDFLVDGEILRASLGEWARERRGGEGVEETLEIEYIESVMPPQKMSSLPHEDWVAAVSCRLPGSFVTASYDGHLRLFSPSNPQMATLDLPAHAAPVTALAVLPGARLVVTGSHDLTARLHALPAEGESEARTLASLHLHTGPVSGLAANAAGSHILSASWDGLVGVWDAGVPEADEVPLPAAESQARKRRKTGKKAAEEGEVRRKAPAGVLRGHTARVSAVAFDPRAADRAWSCGFDATVRAWDVEVGVCTQTISASEKAFLALALSLDGQTALAGAADRTLTMYDVRAGGLSASAGSMAHPAAVGSVCAGREGSNQVVTGAYDGAVRLWDLRSAKSALASMKACEKVLGLDWDHERGLVLVGGEGGVEVWKVGKV